MENKETLGEQQEPPRIHAGEVSDYVKAEDVITTRVVTITEDQGKQQAVRLLSQHRISGLPVVNADQIVVGAHCLTRNLTLHFSRNTRSTDHFCVFTAFQRFINFLSSKRQEVYMMRVKRQIGG
jgi:CBS-domain-containing membrane protein